MNGPPDKKLIEAVALEMGIAPSFVEKDWYVTQAIKTISSVQIPEFSFVFTGGTALSKAHKLIQRFSEETAIYQKIGQGMGRKKFVNLIYGIAGST